MVNCLKRTGQTSRLALILSAVALPSAGMSAAHAASKPDPTTTALARHFQHEDALYASKSTSVATRTAAEAMARHFKHEDKIYGGSQVDRSGRTPAEMIALHFQHEDALYQAQRSASSRLRSALPAQVVASDGFHWNDALVGAGSTVALLLLGTAAMVAIRRGRSRLLQS